MINSLKDLMEQPSRVCNLFAHAESFNKPTPAHFYQTKKYINDNSLGLSYGQVSKPNACWRGTCSCSCHLASDEVYSYREKSINECSPMGIEKAEDNGPQGDTQCEETDRISILCLIAANLIVIALALINKPSRVCNLFAHAESFNERA